MHARPTRLLVIALGLVAGCTSAASSLPPASTPLAPLGSATASTGAPPSSGATALLAGVAVKGRAPKTGYQRRAFGPAWTDDNDDQGGHNGCDTRNDILRRDLSGAVIKPRTHGCVVLSGTLLDPYTGSRIAFRRGVSTSALVQIDHVVALSDAWQTGAQYWPARRRVDFANDPLELLAVSGSANDAKGDGDAATWLPPNRAYRCAYVARQVAVKARYGLWMTAAEKAAAGRVLARCPGQPAPTEPGSPLPGG